MEKTTRNIPTSLFADEALKALGMNLYMLRHNKGLSLQSFSEAINEPISVIEKMELGNYDSSEQVDFDVLIKMIKFYNARIEMNVL